jgi:NAD/NADP transhydrogenase beta subunit
LGNRFYWITFLIPAGIGIAMVSTSWNWILWAVITLSALGINFFYRLISDTKMPAVVVFWNWYLGLSVISALLFSFGIEF